jgi:glycosyltransferase involved in cell wall biosynthesis
MRILHIAPIVANRPSGPAASVPLQMTAELGAGHRVALLQSRPGPAVTLHREARLLNPRARGGLAMWADALRVRRLFLQAGFWPDVAHFHSVYLPQHALIAGALRRLGIPTVNSPRGGLMPTALATSRLKKRIGDRLFFDGFCRGLVLQRALHEHERTACLLRYPNIPVCVVPNPVNLTATALVPPPPPRRDGLVLGFLGRLDINYKGLDLLFEGLARAAHEGLPAGVRLRVCGPGRPGEVDLLRRLAAQLDIEERVTIEGPATDDARQRFFESIDLFVHTSRSEGMPMSVLEAMAASRAVIVTPETNLADIVEQHHAGWVTAGTITDIARTLQVAVTASGEIATRGAAGRRAVGLEFSLSSVGARLTAAYAEALSRSAQAAPR